MEIVYAKKQINKIIVKQLATIKFKDPFHEILKSKIPCGIVYREVDGL